MSEINTSVTILTSKKVLIANDTGNMDKNTFETYEYLPANNSETEQFFVVQEDGTFLINRQVQYVGQVQNVKEVIEGVQPCTVYDVTPQQLLESSEIIPVTDQFILPDGRNNLYPNSYLIQPGSSTLNEQMDDNVAVDPFKQTEPLLNLDVVALNNKQTSNCTEITLSDEQYQMLEQKGWIVLETNDKIYLLDTLGLHDITTNEKLIHKLKTESQSHYNQDTDNGTSEIDGHNLENVTESLPNVKDDINFIIQNDVIVQNQNTSDDLPFGDNNKDEKVFTQENIEELAENSSECKMQNVEFKKSELYEHVIDDGGARVLVIDNDDIRREGSTLKVKTRLSLKNFPDKIVLGKTMNGKRLVAKVVKPKADNVKESDKHGPESNPHSEIINDRKWEVEKNPPAIHLNNLLNESEFLLLIQHLLENNITRCGADDIVAADSVIAQLLQIPAFKSTVMDSNLVVTKTVQNEDTLGKTINKGLTAVVTGKVTSFEGQWHFVHLPYMLQNMVNTCEQILAKCKSDESMDAQKQNFCVLHVQISESKQSGMNIVKVSVTVNKRSIPMDLILSVNKQLPNTTYACSACAALFKSEELLKEHQVNHCLEPDDMLTIDMAQQMNTTDYCVVDNGKRKTYSCMQCDAKFNRLIACKNHLKTHVPKVQICGDNASENSSTNEVYKCSMCPCTYFHPSTLSKHILARHIKMKT